MFKREKEEWPKHIEAPRWALRLISQLYPSPDPNTTHFIWLGSAENEFLCWIYEWFPELADYFNKKVIPEDAFDDYPDGITLRMPEEYEV